MKRRDVLKNDKAVSPVIATILMVAITVVLAATLYMMLPRSEDQENLLAAEISADYSEGKVTVNFDSMVTPGTAEKIDVEFNFVGTEGTEQIFGNHDTISWSLLDSDEKVRGGSEAVVDWDELDGLDEENDLGEPDSVVVFIDGYDGSRSVDL
ncbi:MAG: archaellin/type IV pilin N-terminal domain-containing protein [Thermoplasmata archaeon]